MDELVDGADVDPVAAWDTWFAGSSCGAPPAPDDDVDAPDLNSAFDPLNDLRIPEEL